MFIYLASPYCPVSIKFANRHDEETFKHDRFVEVCKAAARLMENGHLVFCPIAHSHPIEIHGMDEVHGHEFWLEQDFAILDCVDELWVLMLPGWEVSYGVGKEIEFADDAGIPVRYLYPGDVIPTSEEHIRGTSQKAFA